MTDLDVLAFYLPQFHPVPENDEWWGAGFTEWRNVTRARPRFRGHRQPNLPADLGFYDLRLPETRAAQADLARAHGITGFVYYHYWFGGRRILERPFDEVLRSGEPDFPFALCWANENWTRIWDGGGQSVLLAQNYSESDDLTHIRVLAEAFADPRYVRVDGKPLFLVYRASDLPDVRRTLETWRAEAARLGVGELYLCKVEGWASDRTTPPAELGFDAAVDFIPDWSTLGPPLRSSFPAKVLRRLHLADPGYRGLKVYDYDDVADRMRSRLRAPYPRYPCVTPRWDNSPRRATGAVIFRDATPERYATWLTEAAHAVLDAADLAPIVFVNAWNEWAEGNYLEPDQATGHAYLDATRDAIARAVAEHADA